MNIYSSYEHITATRLPLIWLTETVCCIHMKDVGLLTVWIGTVVMTINEQMIPVLRKEVKNTCILGFSHYHTLFGVAFHCHIVRMRVSNKCWITPFHWSLLSVPVSLHSSTWVVWRNSNHHSIETTRSTTIHSYHQSLPNGIRCNTFESIHLLSYWTGVEGKDGFYSLMVLSAMCVSPYEEGMSTCRSRNMSH